MNDSEFAVAVDEILWITPSGSKRDNASNFKAVKWTLEERDDAMAALKDLVDILFPSCLWFEHRELAVPLLAALLEIKKQSDE